jgi:hypothetical protein
MSVHMRSNESFKPGCLPDVIHSSFAFVELMRSGLWRLVPFSSWSLSSVSDLHHCRIPRAIRERTTLKSTMKLNLANPTPEMQAREARAPARLLQLTSKVFS